MQILLTRVYQAYRRKGFLGVLHRALQELFFRAVILPKKVALLYYHKLFTKPKLGTFIFLGKSYDYRYHLYNFTWENERTVELPILWEFVKEVDNKRILEVGNVLSYYYDHQHDIVDKYERRRGVINEDVVAFKTNQRYDLIISCSTLEHVGWDKPDEKDPDKVMAALTNLIRLLNPNGRIIVTFPLGYNAFLDQQLYQKQLPFTELYFLKRISKNNRWLQVELDEVKGSKFNSPYLWANAIAIGIVHR